MLVAVEINSPLKERNEKRAKRVFKFFFRTVATHFFSILKFFIFEGPVSSFDEESLLFAHWN